MPSTLPVGARYATVVVKGRDGRELSNSVDYAKGDPENPMTREEFTAKITSLLQYAGRDDVLLERCLALLDGKADVARLISLL